MPIVLNAFPLKVPEVELDVLRIPYEKETLDDLRSSYTTTHCFRRQGDHILIFSRDGTFPVSDGKITRIFSAFLSKTD